MRIDTRPFLVLCFLVALALVAASSPCSARGEPLAREAENSADGAVGPAGSDLFLAIGGSGRMSQGAASLGFFVSIGGRFDVIVDHRADRGASKATIRIDDEDGARLDADERGAKRAPKKQDDTAAAPDPAPPPTTETEGAPGPRTIDGAMARGLVAAAKRADRSDDRQVELDGLATRARVSALLPEIRVRIGHDVDEGETLAPTEYDPDRVTASGGTKLWIEGRATFRLDRLVFADDEVQIERLRAERAKEDRALTDRVLGLVHAWQAAEITLADPGIVDPDVRAKAEVARLSAEASLDVLTAGWFGAHIGELRGAPH